MEIKVGCCGFPKARGEYYESFKVVEVQQTFYQPPVLKTVERWRTEAPADFEFTLKAWQLITHESRSPTYRRLRLPWPEKNLSQCGSFKPTEEVKWAWEITREMARALKATLVVFQTPASFEPSSENKKNLRRFFKEIDRKDLFFVWEPRGSWKGEEVGELGQDLDLIHGLDPFKGDPRSGKIRYFRIHGITGYRYRFNENDLETLRGKCQGISYCLFNNVSMWTDAREFQKMINKE